MPLTLLVDIVDSLYRIALVDKKKLIFLDAEAIRPQPSLDSVYYARLIEKTASHLLWELSPGVNATSRVERSFPQPYEGYRAHVQITREGFKEFLGNLTVHKPIEVTQNLTFVHETVIFQPYGSGFLSRSSKEIQPQQQQQVQGWFNEIKGTQTPGLIWRGPTSLERLLRDQPWGGIGRIELSSSDSTLYARQACSTYAPSLLNKISVKQPQGSTLLEDYGWEDSWHDTLNPVLQGEKKSSLVFQTTAVATTIDVNAGEMGVKEANIMLCSLLAQQLIWRRLSGRILIDFAGHHPKSGIREELIAHLKSLLNHDSPRWHILGWSNSGLLELQRERRRTPLEQEGN